MRTLGSSWVLSFVAVMVLAGCGASMFGAEGTGAFTLDEKRFFEGCAYEAKGGASVWTCGASESRRVVEHRPCASGQDAAVAAFTTAHPELGPVLDKKSTSMSFTSGGKDVPNPVTVVKQKGTLTMIAGGPSPEATGPSRAPFYAACTFAAPEVVTTIPDAAGLGVGLTLCKNSLEAVLGVVDRHRP